MLDDRNELERLSKFMGLRRGGLWVTDMDDDKARIAASPSSGSIFTDNIQANPMLTRSQRNERTTESENKVAVAPLPVKEKRSLYLHSSIPVTSASSSIEDKIDMDVEETSQTSDTLLENKDESSEQPMMMWHAKLGHTGMKGVVRSLQMYGIRPSKIEGNLHRACALVLYARPLGWQLRSGRLILPASQLQPWIVGASTSWAPSQPSLMKDERLCAPSAATTMHSPSWMSLVDML